MLQRSRDLQPLASARSLFVTAPLLLVLMGGCSSGTEIDLRSWDDVVIMAQVRVLHGGTELARGDYGKLKVFRLPKDANKYDARVEMLAPDGWTACDVHWRTLGDRPEASFSPPQ